MKQTSIYNFFNKMTMDLSTANSNVEKTTYHKALNVPHQNILTHLRSKYIQHIYTILVKMGDSIDKDGNIIFDINIYGVNYFYNSTYDKNNLYALTILIEIITKYYTDSHAYIISDSKNKKTVYKKGMINLVRDINSKLNHNIKKKSKHKK